MTRVRLRGPVAQDKDAARDYRTRIVLPAVRNGLPCVVDFSGVELVTQSFAHALLSEVFRMEGQKAVELLDFKGCRDGVRTVVETVAHYSLQARALAADALAGVVRSVDVPQADRLSTIRAVVDAAADGSAFTREIGRSVGASHRHAQYRLNAARILGFVEMFAGGIVLVTPRGEALASAPRDSEQERRALTEAVRRSEVVGKLAPRLLTNRPPKLADVVRQIKTLAQLSEATAKRRAQVLFSWRGQLRTRQLSLWEKSRDAADQPAKRTRSR
ncbi:MAG: STAS-like domain-containing protein [Myxococcales bacterium]|nr:STAS-like domain-containing protein [Myxococcales bacterium]